jgi:quercetin dioxygenase-like cupin family protein
MSTTFSFPTVIPTGAGTTLHIGAALTAAEKLPAEITGGALAIVEHTLAPGALGAPMHKHDREDEISYVLEGQLTVQQEDRIETVGPGAFVVKKRGIFHTFWNHDTKTVRFLEIITPAGFEHYFVELAAALRPDGPPDPQVIDPLAARYGLTMDMESVPTLTRKHDVSFS